jgi:hypothetical protein
LSPTATAATCGQVLDVSARFSRREAEARVRFPDA